MRKPSACKVCRARRRKCVFSNTAQQQQQQQPQHQQQQQTPTPSCDYCVSHGLKCLQEPPEGGYYAHLRTRNRESVKNLAVHSSPESSVASHDAQTSLTRLSRDLQRELVDLYFEYIHDQFHSLFHRPTFLEDFASGQVPEVILLAIFALSSRFSQDDALTETPPWQRGERFRIASEKLLDIRQLSLITVQACVLLGAYAAANGDTEVENLYYSMAGRTSLMLDLPSRQTPSQLERELNIRTWWTVCMVDVWSSTAVKLPQIMPSDGGAPLPMDDIGFLSLRSNDSILSLSAPAAPLMAEMIRLNRTLSRVIEFNRRCVAENLQGYALESGVHLLSVELDDWATCLPHSMLDTQENLQRFASRGLGRMFVAVYLGYYHYGQLLYYQFLGTESSASTQFVASCAQRCKEHAGRLCDLVYRSFATPDCKVLYSAVAHVVVIASTVQIHALLSSGSEAEINVAKSRLERNFEILLELRPYWTSVDSAMNRLRVFHQTCLRSKDKSFVLDRWLLRFLVEFAAHMEFESRDQDPSYQALLSLSNPEQGVEWPAYRHVV